MTTLSAWMATSSGMGLSPESSVTWRSWTDWLSDNDFHSPQLIVVAAKPAARRAKANVSRYVVVAA